MLKSIFPLLLTLLYFNFSFAQEADIAELEESYKKTFGIEKLKMLNRLTQHYRKINPRKSIKYGKLAVQLGEEIFSESNTQVPEGEGDQLVEAYFQLARVMLDKERYYDAKTNLELSIEFAEHIGEDSTKIRSQLVLDSLFREMDSTQIRQGILSKTLGNLGIGRTFNQTANDLAVQTELKRAASQERKGNFLRAVSHYEKAIDLLKNRGDSKSIVELQLKIVEIYDELEQHAEAQKYLVDAIADREVAEMDLGNPQPKLLDTLKVPGDLEADSLKVRQRELKSLADRFAEEADYEASIAYFRRYQELTLKIKQDSLNSLVENRERQNEMALLRQQKRIADINVLTAEREKQQEIKIRNASIVLGAVLMLGAIGLFYLYQAKRKQHKKLTITFRDLNRTKSKLVSAEKRIVKLLTQQVSADVAQELLSDSPDEPGKHFVCIMFLDIRDFTPMAEKMVPEELIDYQNTVFGFMINAVQNHNGNINQLLGDGFMATFGAPISHGNDCQNAFTAAKEILYELKERNDAGLIHKTKIGIGLHAGYVVTGNVGNESRKQYSVTGNAVIVASRVEQLNKEHKSQLIITEEVYEQLSEQPLEAPAFMKIKLKGKSEPINVLKVV